LTIYETTPPLRRHPSTEGNWVLKRILISTLEEAGLSFFPWKELPESRGVRKARGATNPTHEV